jgi:hypothetical protein
MIDLRRELLLFDHIDVPLLEIDLEFLRESRRDDTDDYVASLEWLASRGVVRSVDDQVVDAVTPSQEDVRATMDARRRRLHEAWRPGDPDSDNLNRLRLLELDEEQRSLAVRDDYVRRVASIMGAASEDSIVLPIVERSAFKRVGSGMSRTDVLHVAVLGVPFPSESTPLEELLDFRADPEIRTDFLALHRWARSVAMDGVEATDLAEEIEYLISQFRRHMKTKRIEQSSSALEVVVTVGAQALENALKLRLADLAKLPFAVAKRTAALTAAELSAPGRELAYLAKAAEAAGHYTG